MVRKLASTLVSGLVLAGLCGVGYGQALAPSSSLIGQYGCVPPTVGPSTNPTYRGFNHQYAEVQNGNDTVKIHYVVAGNSTSPPVLLIHGWPEAWFEWRYVIPALVDAGYYVIAPDTRGVGESSKPATGYDKFTAAEDLWLLLTEVLGIDYVTIVGHDIGLVIAAAYAELHPENVDRLVVAGAFVWDDLIGQFQALPRMGFKWWFASLQSEPYPFPETLIACKEAVYFSYVFDYLMLPSLRSKLTTEDFQEYIRTLSAPGALTAGFNYYRAIWEDVDLFLPYKALPKLKVPVLAIEDLYTGGLVTNSFKQYFQNVTTVNVTSGHFSAEENPAEFNKAVLGFIG